MKRIIALIIVFAMVLPMCLVSAEDSSWESDQYGDTTDEMANNQSSTTSSLTEDEMEEEGEVSDGTDKPSYMIEDYDALFEKPFVPEDYSDQMDEPYAKYGMFLTGTIHENGGNKYNAGIYGNGKLTEEALRADITANLPELQVERILTGNYAFVSDCATYWAKDHKEYMDQPALMDTDGNFSIPADVAEKIFGVKYKESYVPASYIEKVTDYRVFKDIRGFLMFSKTLGSSVDTSLIGEGEGRYYADYFHISDCIGTIAWEDIHPTAEQYKNFRETWKHSVTYPEGMEEEYAKFIEEGIASAKSYMAHIDRNNPVNSPFDNIYIPDLYESGYDANGNKFVSHSNQQGIENAYDGIFNMARGYYLAKRTGAESEEWLKQCRNDIIYALMFMREKHLSNNMYPLAGTPRFTSFRITTFYKMCTSFILMENDLPKQVVYDTLMEFCARNRYAEADYTNRFWLTTPHILTAVILEDDVRLNHGYRYLNQCFTEVRKGEEHPMNTNGFYDDGSFPYHGGLAYNLGYGQSFVISASELISVTKDTVFDISKVHSFDNMYKWIKTAWLPFIYKNMKMKMVVGREAPYASGRHPVAAMLLIADNAPPEIRAELMGYIKPAIEGVESQFYTHKYFPVFRSLSYPYIIEKIDGIINETKNVEGVETTTYNKFYYNMDRVVHMQDGWMFGLAMSSARTAKYESSNTTPVSSLTEWYISDGMTYLHNDDVQYLSPWWKGDPYFLSGTTVDDVERSTVQTMSMSEAEWGKPENLWAGGATTGTIGVAAYENGNRFVTGLDALKSYFMFEDYVVCLGTGITAGSGVVGRTGNAYTVVERRQLVEEASENVAEGAPTVGYEDVIVDGEKLPVEFDNKEVYENPEYIWVEKNTGYVFTGDNTVSLKREVENNYSFLKVVAEHGANVKEDTYGYTILPLATAEETAEWAKNPDVEIIEQSNTMHAVKQKSTGIVMANIFKTTTLEGIKFETPCTVIIVPEADGKMIYVADPTQKSDEVSMLFPSKVSVSGEYAKANGKSVTVTVRKRPGDTYSFKVSESGESGGTSSALKTYSYNIKITGSVASTKLSAYGTGDVKFEIVKNGGYGTATFIGDQLYYTTKEIGNFTDVIQIRATDAAGNSGVFSVKVQRSGK
ncbi:MAG: hypothetical protein IKV86_06770 [Clostridia bacterium]|nr:hypothetical protein [Clostridia bacterium]